MSRRYRKKYYKEDNPLGVLILFLLCLLYKYWKVILFLFLIITSLYLIIKYYSNIKEFILNYKERKILDKLKKKSKLYLNIIKLNSKYYFSDLGIFYDNYHVYYKSNLNNANMDDYLLMTIHNKYNELKEYKIKYDKLKIEYKEYLEEYLKLKELITNEEAKELKMDIKKYNLYQEKIYNDNKINIDTNFNVVIYINYQSKKGLVKEKKYKKYNDKEFSNIINEYLVLKKNDRLFEIISRVERSKMSESLRYDVFKRDNFKCSICGLSAKDGVKLQVDHIIPISKGGKTEIENLQTLCSRCNIGKSNKL